MWINKWNKYNFSQVLIFKNDLKDVFYWLRIKSSLCENINFLTRNK